MFTFENNLFINCPQEEVFDFLSDPANIVHWQGTAVSAAWISDGSPRVGSTFRQVGKFLGRNLDSTLEITAWDPPDSCAQKVVKGPIPFEIAYTVESRGNGTQLTAHGTAELGGFFRMAEGLVGKQLERQINSDFERLRGVLEGQN